VIWDEEAFGERNVEGPLRRISSSDDDGQRKEKEKTENRYCCCVQYVLPVTCIDIMETRRKDTPRNKIARAFALFFFIFDCFLSFLPRHLSKMIIYRYLYTVTVNQRTKSSSSRSKSLSNTTQHISTSTLSHVSLHRKQIFQTKQTNRSLYNDEWIFLTSWFYRGRSWIIVAIAFRFVVALGCW